MTQQLGKYEIGEKLGEGSFARVYRARDVALNRDVALKILIPAWLADPTAVERFKEEAQTMARLERSAHIATIYEVGEANGQIFLAQLLLEGGTIADRLKQGPIPWAETLDVLGDVAAALDYAHDRDIIHRDIKPSNILLDTQGQAYLADFGLVRAAEGSASLSRSVGGVKGTASYIAPEVWEELAVSPATDIYALTCVVFEMLTGNILFDGTSMMAILNKHNNGPRFPAMWPRGVPSDIDAVLRKGLARDPKARFGRANELLIALKEVAHQTKESIPRPEWISLGPMWLVSDSGAGFELKPGRKLTVGRAKSSDLILDEVDISRHHASIELEEQDYVVTDEGSANGTFVNGERLSDTPAPIRHGDHVRFGSHGFTVSPTATLAEVPPKAAAEPVVPMPVPQQEPPPISDIIAPLEPDPAPEATNIRPPAGDPTAEWALTPPPPMKQPAAARPIQQGVPSWWWIVGAGGLSILLVCGFLVVRLFSPGSVPEPPEPAPAVEEAAAPEAEALPATEPPVEEEAVPEPATEEAAAPEPEVTVDNSGGGSDSDSLPGNKPTPLDPSAFSGDIITAGSSTVFPLAERMAERFIDEGFSGNITIDSIGSGAGFERFCVAGESDISNASRPIRDSEIESCAAIGRDPIEFRVGTDALAIVVSAENDFATDVTLQELAIIFSTAETWADVNPAWPNEPIQRFSPGTDSGTFDYFVEEVLDGDIEPFLSASNVQLSEDDNVLVQGILGSPFAVGYFGYAYYLENQDTLQVLSIEGIEPTAESVEQGYPLARPLFLYSDPVVLRKKPQVQAFLEFFLTFVNEEILDVGYFPASENALDQSRTIIADFQSR